MLFGQWSQYFRQPTGWKTNGDLLPMLNLTKVVAHVQNVLPGSQQIIVCTNFTLTLTNRIDVRMNITYSHRGKLDSLTPMLRAPIEMTLSSTQIRNLFLTSPKKTSPQVFALSLCPLAHQPYLAIAGSSPRSVKSYRAETDSGSPGDFLLFLSINRFNKAFTGPMQPI